MSACYICDHPISAICLQCGGELAVTDARGLDLAGTEATEIKIVPCGCNRSDANQHKNEGVKLVELP